MQLLPPSKLNRKRGLREREYRLLAIALRDAISIAIFIFLFFFSTSVSFLLLASLEATHPSRSGRIGPEKSQFPFLLQPLNTLRFIFLLKLKNKNPEFCLEYY